MADKMKYDDSTWDAGTYGTATWKESAPTVHGEAMQRHINKSSNHSERVRNNGKPGAGERVR